MGKSRNIVLFVFLLIVASILTTIPYANAFSERIPLTVSYVMDDNSIERTVQLNQGDRIVGDFTFSNIPVYDSNGVTGMTYYHYFALYDPNGNDVLFYTNNNHASFDQIALYSGVYYLEQSSVYRPSEEIANAQVTLNYNIVQATGTPTQNIESIFFSPQIVAIIILSLVGVCIIAGVFYFYHTKKGNSDPQKEYSEQKQTNLSSSKIVCGSCSTSNDIDAGYCKKCGNKLR